MQKGANLLLKSKSFPTPRKYFTYHLVCALLFCVSDGRKGPVESNGDIKMTILLTGASGMLGSAIGSALSRRGVRVMTLVRREPKGLDQLRWDPAIARLDEPERLEGLDAAVHLSGASVASRRWTAGYKREMTESRVASTQFLSETLAALRLPPS